MPRKIYTIEELCALEQPANQWLVKNVLPTVGRVFLYGHGGVYKSTWAFDLCVAVASRGLLLQQYPIENSGPVLLISTESSKYVNRDRILALLRGRESLTPELYYRGGRAPLPNNKEVQLYYCQEAYNFNSPSDVAEFTEVVDSIKPVLVVLDPLDSFIDGDENSVKDTRPLRTAVNEILSNRNMCICIIHHATKAITPSLRGSSAWWGWGDSIIYFDKVVNAIDTERVAHFNVVVQKQRDGQEGPLFSVIPEYDSVRGMLTFAIWQDTLDPDRMTRVAAAQSVLKLLIERGPLLQKELIDFTGCSYKRVQGALEMLGMDGYVVQDADVSRPTSVDGSRTRTVKAWRATGKISGVDYATALIRSKDRAEKMGDQF